MPRDQKNYNAIQECENKVNLNRSQRVQKYLSVLDAEYQHASEVWNCILRTIWGMNTMTYRWLNQF